MDRDSQQPSIDPTQVHVTAHHPPAWEHDETFQEIMAEQLRRAPWLMLSIALHGVLVLIIWLMPTSPSTLEARVMKVQPQEKPEEIVEEKIEEEQPVEEPPVEEPVLQDVEITEPVDSPDDVSDFESDNIESSFDNTSAWNTAIGLGAGGAKGLGARRNGRRDLARRGGRAPAIAIERALIWLERHQDDDGRWDADDFMKHDVGGVPCDGEGNPVHDIGVTGLALLAFLGDGSTINAGPYQRTVKRAVAWLRSVQDEHTGLFGRPISGDFVYDHALATLAMVEAYGLSESRLLRKYAQRGIDYLESHRNPYGTWRYQPRDTAADTSITGWCLFAYKSAREFGLDVNASAVDQSLSWFDRMTDATTGRTGYTERGGLSSRRNERHAAAFPRNRGECMSAVSLLCRVLLGQDPAEHPVLREQAALISRTPPSTDPDAIDHYYWYYATYAMHQIGGSQWKRWVKALDAPVVHSQRTDGHFAGSWDPNGAWGSEGGRVYSTAMLCLTLEAYYRYGRLLR